MKKSFIYFTGIFALMAFMLTGNVAYSQGFTYSVRNMEQTATNQLEFDVYLLDTDDSEPFELAGSQLGFLFNSLIYTGGTVTVTIDNTTSGLNASQQFTSTPSVVTSLAGYPDQTLIRLAGRTPPGAGNGTIISTSGNGTLLTHFIVTSTVDFTANSTPDFEFCASTATNPLYPTRVSEYVDDVNTALTVTPGVNAIVADNPVLNPPPTAFSVTGGGNYCEGSGGLPVGLSDSETGVTYTLFKDAVAQTPTIEGTGSPISFGNQLAGSYTVTGTNTSGTTDMTGSAVITELAAPASPVETINCDGGAGNAVVTVTSPTGIGYQYSLDGGAFQSSTSFSGVANGSHSITVRNSSGCETTGPVFEVGCGCSNPPTLSLSSTSGSTCGTDPVTVNDNTFGGSATAVTIKHNGSGTINPELSGSSPFSFTYYPVSADAGNVVEIAIATDNPLGSPCEAATVTYSLTVYALPSAPLIGAITQPTCAIGTGSVVLNGLPSNGTWILTRFPGGITTSGTGTSTTVSSLNPGDYNFTVTNSNGCTSPESSEVPINDQPPTPSAPVIGTITPPTCLVATGSVVINGLPSTGTWTVNGSPGGISTSGTGTSATISSLNPGTYTFTVTNSYGCTSAVSSDAVIPEQPPTPGAPVVGDITPPTCTIPTGSVGLSGLPSSGTWVITRYPGEVTTSGTGTSTTVSNIPPGTYHFTVTNVAGCVSGFSDDVVIPAQPPVPSAPTVGTITQTTCDVATGSVVLTGLPSSGSWTLTRSPGGTTTTGTGSSITITGLSPGTYTYTVTNEAGCTSDPSAQITINAQPPTPSAPTIGTINHPTCIEANGSVVLNGLPSTGDWIITRNPGGTTTAGNGTSVTITDLPAGTYTFTVTNENGCTSLASAEVNINEQPPSPAAPTQTIDCSSGAGNALVTITSPLGSGLEYSLDGGIFQSGTEFSGVANGSHVITVRNADGCTTTGSSFDVSCGCANPPTITLSSTSGSTCGTESVTVSGNTFGGSATTVSITHDGTGSVSPASASTSPFSFTYTPAVADAGGVIEIRVTTDNPLGSPCSATTAVYTLTVNTIPGAPVVGSITHPTCAVATGSVVLTGLPSSGTWSLTRTPGNVTVTGTGTTTTVTGIPAGTYTFTVVNGSECTSEPSGEVVINSQPPIPTAPVIGTITHPTCELSTGSVVLEGLPSTGTWTITRSPGSVTRTGTGTSTTFTNLLEGTYTFTVTNSFGCTSVQSEEVVINPQPATPSRPSVGTITPPSCSVATGSVNLFGLPATGTWTLTMYPGTITTTGTGSSTTITGLATGTYNFTVTNAAGCVSLPSSNVVMPAQPPTPTAPVIGMIVQPTYEVPTGSVVLEGLPSSGSWTVTRTPGNVITTGTGTSTTITGLDPGVFNFTVTNSFGCTSMKSADVIISTPGTPTLIITDPDPVCYPETVDLTADEITEGSTPGLTYTYWLDSEATQEYPTPTEATEGTYHIRGTTVSGFFDIQPVVVTVDQPPLADAGPDQELNYVFHTELNAVPLEVGHGTWTVTEGSGIIDNDTLAVTPVSGLALKANVFMWTVVNGVCPPARDSVTILVNDLIIPTLITPNNDPYNEYFVLNGLETLGRTEIIIFDRRGAMVYKNDDYDNSWNGVDQNGNQLPAGTYFYTIKSANGNPHSGYIVIQR
jgi:gliding motility-associated-like protein